MIAIGIGLAFPPLAVVFYFVVVVYLVVPFREVAQVLFGVHDARHRQLCAFALSTEPGS
jgi:hypothetical protein